MRLPREAGKRESRYAHLYSGDVEAMEMEVAAASSQGPDEISRTDHGRMVELEKTVGVLREEIEAIKQRLDRMSAEREGN